MRVSRTNHELDDDYDFESRPARRRSNALLVRAVDAGLRNPVMAAGALVSGLAIIVIVTNALANQPMRHPSPLFKTRDDAQYGAIPVATVPIIVGDNPLKPIADSQVASQAQTPAQALPKPAPAVIAETDPAPTPAATPAAVPPLANLTTQLTERIQQGLRERGFYTGAVDGIAGPGTSEAIRAFETRMGVAATGDVNDRVLALMKSERGRQMRAAPPPPVVPVAAKPVPVAAPQPAPVQAHAGLMPAPVPPEPLTGSAEGRLQRVQRALNVAGYGPIRADGHYDERTGAAIRKYEAEHGLPVTGRLTERLMSELVVRSAEAR